MKYFFFSILILISSCSSPYKKYVVKGNRVYVEGWNEGIGQYKKLVGGASGKDFVVIKTDCNLIAGKDRNNVFIDGAKIEYAHASSFEYVGNYFFKSKDSVYFFGFYNFLDDCEIKGVNPETFKVDSIYPWAHDAHFKIYGNTILDSVDYNSFKILNEFKAQDKFADYIEGKRTIRK